MLLRRRFMNDRIASENGDNLVLQNVKGSKINALTVYGHSTQSGTPSPENPVPIVSAGSVMTTGAQLFDENNTTTGYITDNFIVITNENWIISDFINCNENQNVCISQENNIYYQFRVCFYNSEKVGTSIANYEAHVMLHVFSIPENAKYFKISYSVLVGDESVDRGKIMVNYGSTALPWEPYTGGIPGVNPYDGEINVSVSDGGTQSQTLTLSTPGGLPGIPVDSGGNYTDADGQQWISDEIDFKRGKYVQRVERKVITTEDSFNKSGLSTELVNYYSIVGLFVFPGLKLEKSNLMSNYFISGRTQAFGEPGYTFLGGVDTKAIYFSVPTETFPDAESFKNWAVENGLVVMYKLATPIETPLSPSELAAYAALRTYSPTTVVSNDAGAWMKLGYKTKKSLEVTA